MAEEALVIIDVQKDFSPASWVVQESVVELVERAKAANHAIFVVQLRRYGPTLLPITRALRGYPLAYRVRKYGQDGGLVLSKAIERAWERGDIQHFSKVQFCGLYTSLCVRETFLTLCKIAATTENDLFTRKTALSPATKLVLVERACTDGNWSNNRTALRDVRRAQLEIDRALKFRPI